MRPLLFTCLAVISISLASIAQNKTVKKTPAPVVKSTGYHLPVTLAPYKNTWIYLGCYFGKYKNLADSAWVNEKSEAVFKGKEKLGTGNLFHGVSEEIFAFRILMDKEQSFSIKADTTNLTNVTITGSPENHFSRTTRASSL
jgi:hypothetical protein